ncbi:hypothetical protein [Pararobbsia silviterrae]|uniref:Uncharacterized protein n=1 Tax=Pararobbsia silviterrae TaxID=1792498 RepID=A0A494X711_9BURK|nr:hypothetical protein [Pararobbsia silviterrae]RKP43789.1 hypothetical protein D7S86_28375 [Pararobbsia silviterrae]
MTYGARIYNANGFLQITGQFKNLAFRAKGSTVSGGTALPGHAFYQASYTFAGSAVSILAFACAAPCAILSCVDNGNGTFTATFAVNGTGVTVQVFVFDDPAYSTIVGNYGVRVRTDDGSAVAFDSRTRYMRVINFVGGSEASGTGPDGGVSYNNSSSSIAVVQTQLRCDSTASLTIVPPSQFTYAYNFAALVASISGAQLALSKVAMSTYGGTVSASPSLPPSYSQTGWGYLILDVSNF